MTSRNFATALRRYTSPNEPVVRLICFPNAGGGASIYRRFVPLLPKCIELVSVQLRGREDRIHETAYTDMQQAATAVALEIARLDATPTVLFGHSMGALLAFEAANVLVSYGRTINHLIVSGRGAPDAKTASRRCRGDADDGALMQDLVRLGGTPSALLDDLGMRQLIIKVLRADYALLDRYVYTASALLSCPITAFSAYEDAEVTAASISAWKHHTTGNFCEQWFQGGHFYLFADCQEFVRKLQQRILL